MTVKIDGTNTVANPAFTGADTDTGLQCGTNEVKLVTGGTARATINSSGQLGIGTESPQGEMHLHAGDSNGFLRMTNTTTGATSADGALFQMNGNDLNINNLESGNFIFYTADTERMRLLSTGGLTFKGDTADANALDDYEEGEWTPAAQQYDGTITINSADYVKVGQLVHVSMYISFSNTSDSSDINITGLPYTVAGDGNNHYSLFTAHTNGNLPNFHLRPQGTTNQMLGVYLSGGNGDDKPNYSDVASKFIIMGGTYRCTP